MTTRRPGMRSEDDRNRADKIAGYAFLAGVAVSVVSFAIWAAYFDK